MNNKEIIKKLLIENPTCNNVDIAKLYIEMYADVLEDDVNMESFRKVIGKIRKKNGIGNVASKFTSKAFYGDKTEKKVKHNSKTTKVNNDKGTLESEVIIDFDPKDDLALAKAHKVDLTKYKISNYWTKQLPDGRFTSSLLCTLRKVEDTKGEDILNVLKNYKSTYEPLSRENIIVNKDFFDEKTCAFIDLTDFHLDKRTIDEYPIEKKIQDYHLILENLLKKAHHSNYLEEITFVIGSDMLHTDTYNNQTTKLTPQETTVRWNEAFDIAFDIYVQSINKLKQFCEKLNVILIQGNHSMTKEYYLAFAVQKYFEREKNIVFDIRPIPRKVFVYGVTFIGLHHGNTKLEQLPLIFSKEFGKEWGNARYHEIKVGDKHHFMEKDYAGIRIKQLPALSGTDTWHNESNYVNSVQSAICTIYSYDKGRILDIEEKIHS